MITASKTGHGPTIDELALRQKWPPVSFEVNGQVHTANSVWAATDWLKKSGLASTGVHRWIAPEISRKDD